MNSTKTRMLVGALCAALYGSFVTPASADMVLGYENGGPGGDTVTGSTNSLSVPGNYIYGNTFSAPTTTIPGSPSPGYGFYDDFVFSIPTGAVDSISSTIQLSLPAGTTQEIGDFQVRLYNTTGNPSLPVLGNPTGGAIDSWSSMVTLAPGETGTVGVLPITTLLAGTYVLEVRGNVLGSQGGSYSGTLQTATVPLPAGLPLLFSGLGLIVGLARRWRSA